MLKTRTSLSTAPVQMSLFCMPTSFPALFLSNSCPFRKLFKHCSTARQICDGKPLVTIKQLVCPYFIAQRGDFGFVPISIRKSVLLRYDSNGAVASFLVRSSPDRVVWVRALAGNIALCSWTGHFTLTVPLSTQEYKWVPANLMSVASYPRGVRTNTPSHLMLHKRDKLRLWLVC